MKLSMPKPVSSSRPGAPAPPPPPSGQYHNPIAAPVSTAPAPPPPPSGQYHNPIAAPTAPGAPAAPTAPLLSGTASPLTSAKAPMGSAVAMQHLTNALAGGVNAVAALATGTSIAQQVANKQQTQANAAQAQPSTYASGYQTTTPTDNSGSSGSGDGSGGGDGSDGSSQDSGGGSQDDGSQDDGGSEADFQQFVQQYYAQNAQGAPDQTGANAAPAQVDPNAAAQAAASVQAPAAPVAQGVYNAGSPHPHRGFFARLLAALSGEDPAQAAQTQAAILQAVQQSQQAAQVAAQAAVQANAGNGGDATAGGMADDAGSAEESEMGLEIDGGWTRNNQDWTPSSYGSDPTTTLPNQGPVCIYAQNGVLTATGMTQSPYGKIPVCVGVPSPVPVNNGPVTYGVDPEIDHSIGVLKQILFDKSLYEAQRDAAAHLVLSSRLGDQVAWAMLNEIKRSADSGDIRAANAEAIILDFIRKHPVDQTGFAGDTSDSGATNPLQRSVNQLASGPAISAGRARSIATTFGGGSRRRARIVFHGMANHDDSPETTAKCENLEKQLSKLEKELHKIGRLIGRARGLQMARRKGGKISDFDKQSGKELGETA